MEIKGSLAQSVTIILYIIIGVLTRTVWHIGPNIEFVTAISIAGGFFLKRKSLAFLIPLITMMVSDSIIKNTNIFLFTWSAFVLSPLVGILVRKMKKWKSIGVIFGSLCSILFFYLWTNFGVVIVSSLYTKDLNGLIHSYINGLPFLYLQVIGNIFAIPVIFAGTILFNRVWEKLMNFSSNIFLLHK